MLNILKFNSSNLDMFSSKNSLLLIKSREGKGTQSYKNGMSITGIWKNDKIEGEGILKFKNSKTEMKGFFSEGSLTFGSILYDTGVRIEGEFHSNLSFEVFKTVTIIFISKYYFKGEYTWQGCLIKGSLFDENRKLIATWNNKKIIKCFDKDQKKGIVIGLNSFYEGELDGEEYSGNGVEYLVVGLVFYKYERIGKDFDGKISKFCFHLDNQYQNSSYYENGLLIHSKTLHANGVLVEFNGHENVNKQYKITTKGNIKEVLIIARQEDFFFPAETKGFFVHKEIQFPILFKQENMNFEIIKDEKIYSIEDFFSLFNKKEDQVLTTRMYSTVQKHHEVEVKEPLSPQIVRPHFDKNLEEGYAKTKRMIDCKICDDLKHKCQINKSEITKLQSKILIQEKIIEELKIENNNLKNREFLKEKAKINESSLFFNGTLIDNKKNGFCEEILENEYFSGNYQKGLKNGEGFYKKNEIEYIGSFENDLFHGKGTKINTLENKQLIGDFFQNRFIGNKLIFKKCEFQGDIKDEKMNGFGVLKFLNDYEFCGLFKDDKIIDDSNHNVLTNISSKKEYQVNYKYSKDLSCDMLISETGDVFTVDFDKGFVLKIK